MPTPGIRTLRTLLIKESDDDVRLIQDALAVQPQPDLSVEMQYAGCLSEALDIVSGGDVDLVLLNLRTPEGRGAECVDTIRQRAPDTAIVILTASDDDELTSQALRRGAQDYLVKSQLQASPRLLGQTIRHTLESKGAKEELKYAHDRSESLLASIPSILIGVSAANTITHWSYVAARTFGKSASEVIDRPLAECQLNWDTARILAGVAECEKTSEPVRLDDVRFRRADGQEGFLGITIVPMRGDPGAPSGLIIFGADITERKQVEAERKALQEQLLQAQKMEIVGRFAGGIAHDFHNFLQVILGFAWLIRSRHQDDRGLMGDIQEITHAAESASGMVKQLLTFSRRRSLELKVFEMNQAVQGMERLLKQLVGDTIKVKFELEQEDLPVKLDPTGLEQILMNLCSNARDAMPDGGTLTVSTKRVVIDALFLEVHSWAKQGEYVRVSVSDTGKGMDPKVAAHIFEPFFTTKKVSAGTGLGMAVVYGLVTQHDGLMDVETSLGNGTTFYIYFPYHKVPIPEAAIEVEGVGVPTAGRITGKPRILVVDNDAGILQLCVRILEEANVVTAASSGRVALDQLTIGSYDLLLTDLAMPEMDGLLLLEQVIPRKPNLAVVVMTGSMTKDREERLRAIAPRCKLIQKPFSPSALRDVINQSLS